MSTSLNGRSAIITGASEGLGAEIARHYVRAGANVLVCARREDALGRMAEELRSLASPNQKIISLTADVSRRSDTDRIVKKALHDFGDLHILVNNAGVYGPKGSLEEVDWDEWTQSIEINLYGSVLMCRAVLPHFKQRQYGKIVQLSGGGATNPLPRISGYAASKAAIVRLAETLAEEVRQYHIDVNSIAPGALNTRLLDEVLEAGPAKVGTPFYEKSLKQKQEGGSALSKGAELAVFLASAASDGITGKLLSAVWDPWSTLQEHADELRKSDIYTLRRIVPKDRGATWGD
jgi:NAD(P)-dependent dehydrogenase (short-subunit alcohol dehydrogenase family)